MADQNGQAPSWLTDTPAPASAPAPAAAPAPSPAAAPEPETFSAPAAAKPASAPAPAAASTPGDSTALTAEEEETLKGVILFTRLANLCVSIAVAVMSTFRLVYYLAYPQYYVLCFYASMGSILICCVETQLKFVRTHIALNFGFLFSAIPRFFFYIFLATVCWSLGDIFAQVCAGCLVGIAFYNTYVIMRYPAYRKLRDAVAKEEDERINAAIREKVRKEATSAMFTSR